MTAKKTVSVCKKCATKKHEPIATHKETILLRVETLITVKLDVPNGELSDTGRVEAISDFIGKNLMVDMESNDHTKPVTDVDINDWHMESYDPILPEHMDASAGTLMISGSGEQIKDLVDSLREAYDSSGSDMPKHLHDIVFSFEVQMGIV